jgi:hypothetical protein
MRRRNELRLLLQFDFSRKKRKQANEFVVPVDQKSFIMEMENWCNLERKKIPK